MGDSEQSICEHLQYTKATGEGNRKEDMIMIRGKKTPDEEVMNVGE